jgi:hypothetical protein
VHRPSYCRPRHGSWKIGARSGRERVAMRRHGQATSGGMEVASNTLLVRKLIDMVPKRRAFVSGSRMDARNGCEDERRDIYKSTGFKPNKRIQTNLLISLNSSSCCWTLSLTSRIAANLSFCRFFASACLMPNRYCSRPLCTVPNHFWVASIPVWHTSRSGSQLSGRKRSAIAS